MFSTCCDSKYVDYWFHTQHGYERIHESALVDLARLLIAYAESEVEIERERARADADAGMMLAAYLNGWKARRAAAESDLSVIDAEEAGARDALTGAFEELKKFEHVAETTRLNKLIAIAKRETAAFDELGLRKRAV